jgi:hypothetical protein
VLFRSEEILMYGYQQPVMGSPLASNPQIAMGYPPPELMMTTAAPNPNVQQPMLPGSVMMTDQSMMPVMPTFMMGQSPATFDPINILSKLSCAKLAQDANYLSRLTGCEAENVYTVYVGDDNNPNVEATDFNRLFYCKEHSTCSQRICFSPDQREFNMDMSYKRMKQNTLLGTWGVEWVPFIKVFRPYACTYCCCNRPMIEVDHFVDGKKVRLGTIVNEWTCCDFSFMIREGTSEAGSFRINGDCCQLPMLCKCRAPCAACHEAVFELFDCRKEKEERFGQINKVWSGTIKETISNADEYTVLFPKKSTWKQKILILCCMVFIDYCYFESNSGVRTRRGRGCRRMRR